MMEPTPAGRWTRLTPPQQFVAVLIPFGIVLALALSLLDPVPDLAKDASIKLGLYDDVQGGIFGIHPWTWAHFFGWLALTAAVAVALVGVRRAIQGGILLFGASIAIEVMQDAFTSERGFSSKDVLANGMGVIAGVSVGLCLTHWWVRRTQTQTARS